MEELVSFPGLGLEFLLDRVAFSVPMWGPGGWYQANIYWYGLLIAFGAFLGGIYGFSKMKYFGIDPDRAMDVILAGTVFGGIGARLYYIAFSGMPLSEFFAFRDGGLGFYGSVIGAFAAAIITARLRKVKILPVLDLAAAGFLIGQGIGRWGNFVNQEAFGGNTSLPWGMTSGAVQRYLAYNADSLSAAGMAVNPELPVHPTFLYESIWCLLGFLAFNAYFRHRRFDGELLLMYFGWNGLGRAAIEGLRTDSLYAGPFRVSQLLAVFGVVIAVLAIGSIRRRIRLSDDPEAFRPYGMTERCVRDMCALTAARAEAESRRLAKKRGEPRGPEAGKTVTVCGASFVMTRQSEKPEGEPETGAAKPEPERGE